MRCEVTFHQLAFRVDWRGLIADMCLVEIVEEVSTWSVIRWCFECSSHGVHELIGQLDELRVFWERHCCSQLLPGCNLDVLSVLLWTADKTILCGS